MGKEDVRAVQDVADLLSPAQPLFVIFTFFVRCSESEILIICVAASVAKNRNKQAVVKSAAIARPPEGGGFASSQPDHGLEFYGIVSAGTTVQDSTVFS